MRLRRLPLFVVAALVGFATPALASSISLLSGSQYSEPSQVLNTVNTVIRAVNTQVGANGAGTVGSGLVINNTSSAINALSITPGATTVAPILSVGDSLGAVSDTNIGIVLTGKGSGRACLAGSTCANSTLSAVTTASAVNGFILTSGATGTAPSLVTGGTSVDTNVGMFIAGAGTGPVYIGGTSTTLAGLQVAQTASRVNAIAITPSATGTAPAISIGGAGADANRNLSVAAAGTGIVALGQTVATCSGTTTSACAGQRFISSITGLTTAAGAESAAMTVTNASVVASTSTVLCNVNIYAGTGVPIVARITPGTGTVSFVITNVGSAGLNATVPVHCLVTG